MAKDKNKNHSKCGCENEHCKCDENCKCGCQDGKECSCNEHCDCGCECGCESDDNCDCGCDCHDDQMQEAYNYLELAQRIKAEFDNYRKRTQEEASKARENGIAEAVEKLLPIVDSLENAKKQVKDENFLKAIDVIDSQLQKCFESLNVKRIDALNKPFDPNFHNAILQGEEKDKESDIVLEVFQEGFTLNGKVIRHSAVKVNK